MYTNTMLDRQQRRGRECWFGTAAKLKQYPKHRLINLTNTYKLRKYVEIIKTCQFCLFLPLEGSPKMCNPVKQQQRKTTNALRGADSAGLSDWARFPAESGPIWQHWSLPLWFFSGPAGGAGRSAVLSCLKKTQARNKMALHASVTHFSRLTGRLIGSLSIKCTRNTTLPATRRYISRSTGNSEWFVFCI